MIGEISLGGVYIPVLLLLFGITLPVTFVATQLLNYAGFYRFVTYRALVDLAIFILLWGASAFLFIQFGPSL